MKMRLKFRDITPVVAAFGTLPSVLIGALLSVLIGTISVASAADDAKASQVSPETVEQSAAATTVPAQASTLNGSWTLVSGRYLDGEGQWVDYQSLGLSAIKVISAGHFSFTTVKTVKGKREFWAAGSGKYRLDGKRYTEFPTLNSFDVPEGQGFEFEFELIGNEWHTRRVEEGVLKEEEVWRRLD
ncbi:hypothetical protein KJI95_09350 [Shewanella sp. JM162201]|uniref:DUF4488 domain-containing protein n=1 Tax=Shewanella jiangmenensis TaxID=2837387 RepID=A0ABS5V4G4_9GAMM|nr:hypothetical protein [Shewanella jiangmenensis]MBT1444725.1 hypothetical protein [Shewanella jiangmenensis]